MGLVRRRGYRNDRANHSDVRDTGAISIFPMSAAS
jgi:hypothetical protein